MLGGSHTHTEHRFRRLPSWRKDAVNHYLKCHTHTQSLSGTFLLRERMSYTRAWEFDTHTHSTTAFARSLNRDEAPCLKLSTGACSVPCPPSGSLRPLHAWNAQLTHCQMEPPGCFAPLDLHKTALLFRQVSPGQPLHLAYTENTY